LLPGPPGSLVLSANLQVLCGCLPTCSSRSLWGFPGHPSGVVTRPPDNLVRFVGHMVRQAALRRGGAAEAGARRAWDTAHHG
jgi:hypothetical protein